MSTALSLYKGFFNVYCSKFKRIKSFKRIGNKLKPTLFFLLFSDFSLMKNHHNVNFV